MKLPGILRQVFPPARRPVTPGDALPLVLFLAAFGVGCAFVEWRGILAFSAPWAFLLMLSVPWIWWMHVAGYCGLSGWRALMALIVRLVLAAVFVLLLAQPRAVRRSDTLTMVYALDLSNSMGESVSESALEYVVATASQKPEKDEAGLVVFARDAAVELPPRQSLPFEAINSRVAKDATNLAQGLSLAAAMVPEENPGRVVLITDGNETEGDLDRVLAEMKARKLPVDVLPVQFDYDREVWLEKLELPRFVKQGETYEASVILSSLRAGVGTLRLRENGKEIFRKDVEFASGKNRFTLPLYLREPGYYEYVADISVPEGEDGWEENNLAISDLFLKGEGRILLVTNPDGDPREYRALAEALKASQRSVDVVGAFELPRDALSLMPYDCIVFANVPADALDVVQMQAVRDSVFNQGSGFLMVGGPNSFGPGGYHRTAIEEALPVTMDVTQKKVLPKGALVIVLHTCEFPEGNTWAKRIAKEAIRVLSSQDEVGLIAFLSNGDEWVFPLTPASEYEKLAVLINQASPGDMPSFQTSMRMGLTGLKENDAALKHMIIISDGDPSPPTPQLIGAYQLAKVSVSTVAINPHGGQDISIMESIAQSTGGRYYFAQDPSQLPSIFVKEAKTLRRNMIQNKEFTPTVEFPSPVLKGIDAMPPLFGYVLTTPKPRATTVLKGPETEEVDPVLATWRFGIGTTAAFTSDLSPNWGKRWIGWDHYRAFVKQLITAISRVDRKSDLNVATRASGGTGVVTVEDFFEGPSFLEMRARVTGPYGRETSLPLKQIGPRRYEGDFPLWGKGRYQVLVAGSGGDRNEQAISGLAVPYSAEYLKFRSDPILLQKIADRTGGRVLTGNETGEQLYGAAREARESSRPVMDWFLFLLAFLIPLDVAVRRVQLDWALIAGWFGFGRKREESGETFSALLRRKDTVTSTLRRDTAPRKVVPTEKPAPATETPPPEVAPGDETPGMSTTERLLARKRKREKHDEE